MHISELEISNFANIGHIVMQDLGDIVMLEGKNGVGKTEILTALVLALEGKTSLDRPAESYIRNGYESSIVRASVSDGSQIKYKISVTITKDDFKIAVKELSEDGKMKSVTGGIMALLGSIVNSISFRPQQWRKQSDQNQLDEVFKFFPELKSEISIHDQNIEKLKKERASALQTSEYLRSEISKIVFTPGLPEKEEDPAEISEEIEIANTHNLQRVGLENAVSNTEKDIAVRNEMIISTTQNIDHLKKELERKLVELNNLNEAQKGSESILASNKERLNSFVLKDVEPLKKKMATVNNTNILIRNNAALKIKQQQLEKSELLGQELYRKIESVKDDRNRSMQNAQLPIEGVSIGDGCLLYPNSSMDMVPLSALSDGEFWPVSIGVVAAFNPAVAVVIIDNYHDLDEDNWKIMCDAAKKHGLQVWVHKTLRSDKDFEGGFLIRGGEIVTN